MIGSALAPAFGTVPAHYLCEHCGATGCKLWRLSGSSYIGLACINCLRKHTDDPYRDSPLDPGGFHLSRGSFVTDQYCYYVPAIPAHVEFEFDGKAEEEDSYFGYTSSPPEGIYWWRWLPNEPS